MKDLNVKSQILSDFLINLPRTVPSSRISVLNIPRFSKIENLLTEEIKNESALIDADNVETEEIIEMLDESIKDKKFIFLNFFKRISPLIYSQLETLAEIGTVYLYDRKENEWVDTRLPEGSHIILTSERKFIEGQYQNLNELTSYVLDLENL
jgi:hypothetical protein